MQRRWVATANSKNTAGCTTSKQYYDGILAAGHLQRNVCASDGKLLAYNRAGKRGIGCGLGNVMKTRDGEPLAGGSSAAADFAGIGQTPGGQANGGINPLTGQPF